jgi:hypothetical protein
MWQVEFLLITLTSGGWALQSRFSRELLDGLDYHCFRRNSTGRARHSCNVHGVLSVLNREE